MTRTRALLLLTALLTASGACASRSPSAVGPPAKADTTCDLATDCMAWPSGCCQWKAVNKTYSGPPAPGAGCDMECPGGVPEVVCSQRVCVLARDVVPPEHPYR